MNAATSLLLCPHCHAGPKHLSNDWDHGQLVCTSCGAVLSDSLLFTDADQGVYQGSSTETVGPSAATRIQHLQGALRDSIRQSATVDSGAVSQSTSTQRSQQTKVRHALQELDSFAQLLDLPDCDWPELRRLFLFVVRRGKIRWGFSARLAAAACIVLLSRKLGAAIPLHTASKRLHMDLFTLGQYLGRVRLLAARFYIGGQQGNEADVHEVDYCDNEVDAIKVNEHLHKPDIAAILAAGSSEEQLTSLALSILDDMSLDPPPNHPTLIQAWQQAAARGDVTSLRHFSPLDHTNGDRACARLRLPTILKLTSHLFESRRPPACALAVACIAREAQEATPCSAAMWAALLGSCNPGTALVHQREAVDAIVDAAKPLPWFHEIKTSGSGRNAEHFLGQILDLVEAGVLHQGDDDKAPPSFLRGKRSRQDVEMRVRRAVSKLAGMGTEVDLDVCLAEYKSDSGEESKDQVLILADVDVAIESLLVYGWVPVSQLLGMTGRDIVVAADLLAQQQLHQQLDLDASEVGDQDLTEAEQQMYIPYVEQS